MSVNTVTKVRKIIEDNPGIQPCEVAEKVDLTRGRVSQVVGQLIDSDEVIKKPKGKGVAVGLHLSERGISRKYLRERWRKR